ncbi:MAG TPA: invasion associated locus B family protein [Alphaproteobacteria bacterium]|nr:invasion associated locus B family protein [Alphaproteobacteria bacterium]
MWNLAKALILAAVLAGSPIGQAALSQGSKATSAPALSEPKALGTFGQWTAAELTQAGGKICYMVSRPAKSEGKYSKRGDVLLVVTHRPASKSFDVVTFQAGYAFASGAKVPVNIDGKKFELLARPDFEKESAWAPDAKTDKALIAALRSGKTAIVQGTSARHTETSDTFGLIGFTRAYATIGQACGVK